jgi:hypothetical protein
MIKMNIKEFAAMLDGRGYGEEIIKEERERAKELGFVVVFGYSDDTMIFAGAIDDDASSRTVHVSAEDGLFVGCDDDCIYSQRALSKCKKIEAIWCGDGVNGFCWTYRTDIPHETFEIFEDGEKYCRGIVFDIKSL